MKVGIEKISDGIQEIVESTRQTREIATQSSQTARQGRHAMTRSLENSESMQRTATQMRAIVSTISDIANQTTLLAFNAAI